MAEPKLLLIDEVSLGLMPKNVDICHEVLDRLRSAGLTIILVGQSLERVLSIADLAWERSSSCESTNPTVVEIRSLAQPRAPASRRRICAQEGTLERRGARAVQAQA